MSLVNIDVDAGRALVCVDTRSHNAAAPGDAGAGDMSKIAVLPHAGIVFTVRGVNLMLTMVHGMASHVMPATFAAVAEVVPKAMRDGLELVRVKLPASALVKQEIGMVGYCEDLGRMRCRHFVIDPSGEMLEDHEMAEEDLMLSPWDAKWGLMVESCPTPEAMRMISVMQVNRARADHPGTPIGGRLLLARVTKGAVSISTLAEV